MRIGDRERVLGFGSERGRYLIAFFVRERWIALKRIVMGENKGSPKGCVGLEVAQLIDVPTELMLELELGGRELRCDTSKSTRDRRPIPRCRGGSGC